jgi:hypothetical protein
LGNYEKDNLSFKYPQGVEIQEKGDKTVFRFRGQGQADSPELVDGLLLEFYVKNFQNNAVLAVLEDEVQKEIQRISESPLEEISQSSQKIQIASLNGYKFTTQGMVETRYYLLQLNDNQYLYIVDSSQTTSDQILINRNNLNTLVVLFLVILASNIWETL